MRRGNVEIALLVLASAMLLWGVARAVGRGEPAVGSWTTYVMGGLVLASLVNIRARARPVALAVVAIAALLGLTVGVAAFLGPSTGGAFPDAAVLRAILFLASIGAVGVLQAQPRPSARQPPGAGSSTSAASADP